MRHAQRATQFTAASRSTMWSSPKNPKAVSVVGVVVTLMSALCPAPGLADDERTCPTVKAIRHLHLHDMLGHWFVVQYFASSEELPEYRCMRADLSLSLPGDPGRRPGEAGAEAEGPRVNMNFTYAFSDDPMGERLHGNLTWLLPDLGRPAHWRHQEESYQGVYNTYVLDSDYTTWALLLHCAEQTGSLRYLSSFILSRTPGLAANVQAYLRDKLTRYAIDLDYMFPMSQDDCDALVDVEAMMLDGKPQPRPTRPHRKHPLQRKHDRHEGRHHSKG